MTDCAASGGDTVALIDTIEDEKGLGADRHKALGSNLEDWIGMPTPWTYDKELADDYIAIRTKAGLMDVSGLKKVHLVGPHAAGSISEDEPLDTQAA